MNRKANIIVVALLLIVLLGTFLFLRARGNENLSSKPDTSDFYIYNNNNVSSGFTYTTSNGQTGRVIGKLLDIEEKSGQVVGTFDFQTARSQVILFSPDLPTELSFQTWREIGYPSYVTSPPPSLSLNKKDKAISELNKLIGSDIIITLALKDEPLNKSILDCNSQFMKNINTSTLPDCTPESFRLSVYRP